MHLYWMFTHIYYRLPPCVSTAGSNTPYTRFSVLRSMISVMKVNTRRVSCAYGSLLPFSILQLRPMRLQCFQIALHVEPKTACTRWWSDCRNEQGTEMQIPRSRTKSPGARVRNDPAASPTWAESRQKSCRWKQLLVFRLKNYGLCCTPSWELGLEFRRRRRRRLELTCIYHRRVKFIPLCISACLEAGVRV